MATICSVVAVIFSKDAIEARFDSTALSLAYFTIMKRIKPTRVRRLIADCNYWLTSNEEELFREDLDKLLKAAGQDHPLVIQYLDYLTKLNKI